MSILKNIKFNPVHLFAILLFALITIIYCFPITNGEKINQGDYKQFLGMSQEILDYRAKTGEEALWTNSMFGGMPAYQISVHHPNNILVYIDKFFQLYLPRPIGIMFLYFLGFYIFLLSLKINPHISILGALAFGMSSYFFIILEAGHNTKAHAIAYLAPSVASMIYCFRPCNGDFWYRVSSFFFAFLSLGLHLRANHLQITYYLLFILFAFWLYYLIRYLKEKHDFSLFVKSTLVFFVAGLMSISINLGNIWSTYEYSQYTIRGNSELVQDSGEHRTGLSKEYATAWSYGKMETFNLFFPNFMGGSSHSKLSEKSNLYQVLRDYGVSKKDSREYIKNVPTYFGPQDFTSGPVYIGAIVWLLFIMALFLIKQPIKWVFVSLILFSFILAWGKYFPIVTNFFLDFFPLYNKFRTVSMILVIVQFAVPAFAFYGLYTFINSDVTFDSKKRAIFVSSSILIGISCFFLLFGNILFDFQSHLDAQIPYNWFIDALIEDRRELFKADILRSLFFVCSTAGLLYYVLHNNLHAKKIWLYVLAILLLTDMWIINKRYLNSDDFVAKSIVEVPFESQFFDNMIKQDTSVYRVYNLNERLDQGARTSYFHHSLGGYHGAKLGKYQDIISQHLLKGNMNVINMLNAKYIILNDTQGQTIVQENTNAVGNVWLVDSIHWVNSANEEIESLHLIDPENIVAINNKYKSDILNPISSSGTIKLVSYEPNKLVYTCNLDTSSFAVFSEIFYPKGWEAYIDGVKVNYFPVNYILRGLPVPSGKHEIIFQFKPKSFFVSAKVSLVASFLLMITAFMTFIRFTFLKQ